MPKSCCSAPNNDVYPSIVVAAFQVYRNDGPIFRCIDIKMSLNYNGFFWQGVAGPLTLTFGCSAASGVGTGTISYNDGPCVFSDSSDYDQGAMRDCSSNILWAWGQPNVIPMEICCGHPQSQMTQEVQIFQGIPVPNSVSIGYVPCKPPDPKGCPCPTSGGGGGGGGCSGKSLCAPTPPIFSVAPVRYATGEMKLVEEDISSDGFGMRWGHTRSFRNRQSVVETLGQGFNWQVAQWQHLVIKYEGTITVMGEFGNELWFDKVGSGYVARFGMAQQLTLNAGTHRYQLTDLDGTVTEFDSVTGMFRQKFDPDGNYIAVTALHANGYNLAQVERSYTSGGVTTVEQFFYDYQKVSGDQMVSTVTLRRKVGSGSWENVTKADYAYYLADDAHGLAGDLKTATTSTWLAGAWVANGTSYYRYWVVAASSSSSSSSSSSGPSRTPWGPTAHQLKYVLKPSAFQRLSSDPSVSNPFTASDAIVSLYADYYFEYDSERRVSKEIVESGSRTFQFGYSTSGFSDNYNHWKTKTIETLPDGTQNIIYANYAGQTMLAVFQSGSDQWCEFYEYDDHTNVVMMASASAISGYDESQADLLNKVAGNYQYLKDHDGLIRTYAYHCPTNYVTAEKIRHGELGGDIQLREREYVLCGTTLGGAGSGGSFGLISSSSSSALASSSSSSSSAPSSSSSSSSSGSPCGPFGTYYLAKETLYPSDTDQTKKLVTTYDYLVYSGTCAVKQKTTTLPAVGTDQNGSGVAATRKEYFDTYGNLTWSMDERGFITRTKYDIVTGAVTQRIDDVDTSVETDAPSGWTTPTGGGLNLVTDFESDSQGRITQVLGPAHAVDLNGTPGGGGSATTIRRATWMVYKESSTGNENWTGQGYQKVSDSSFTLINPVSITKMDVGGRVTEQIQATRASTSGKLTASDSFAQSSYVAWTTTQFTDCCFAASRRVYHTIPTSGTGSSGTNYDETDYGYTAMKRQNRVVTPGGTITDTVFDARGHVLKTYIGTNDDGATEEDPTGGGVDPDNNMVLISVNEFDNGLAGYDGNLTKVTQYVTASDTRVTTFCYDWRDRRTDTDGEIDYYEKTYFDNLDRVIKSERYNTIGPCSSSSSSSSSGSSIGNLIARSETKFDDRGRVYQTIRYAVNVSTGVVGNALTDNTWFDASGNVIKQQPAGSSLFTKPTYDGLRRRLKTYRGYDLTETSYSDISTVVGDTIIEQQEATYDAASNVIQSVTRMRYHNATGTGELNGPAGPQPKARVTYQASYPDPLGRSIAMADYGTNGGTSLTRSATVPARSDTVLVTTTAYNSAGRVATTTNPSGIASCLSYDAAGRQTTVVMNCTTSSSSSSSSGGCPESDDMNVTVTTAYNGDGNVSSLTANNSATGNQTTQFVYGTTLSNSDIASSLLKQAEIYPDSVDSDDKITFQYNRQRQVRQVRDQNGTIHAFDFDKLGRQTQDRVTTLGTGVDGAIRRIASSYEVRGMRTKLTSWNGETVGSGSVVNDVQFTYNDFAQLIADYQSHSGTVNTSTTPKVQYGYANGSANTIRPTSLTYPNGRVITYDYSTSGSMPDALSRIDAIKDGSLALAQYSYLGSGTFVVNDYTEPDIKWTLADLSGTNDPDTGDIYSGFDRFGRVKDNRWYNYGSATDVDRIKYGYDRNGNRTYRENTVATAAGAKFDEKYLYDLIDRLKHMDRGELTALKDSITNKTFAQCWQLDATGNWKNFREDDNGDGTWDLNQQRENNPVNEITNISETAGPSWVTPAYNRAGNMTTIPKPADPTVAYTGIYDAWNRLVAIKEASDYVTQYEYDGAKRRTEQKTYTAGTLTETRHLYYTEPSKWQVLEERLGSSTSADRQFIWGLRYIDDLILRDRDTDANGSLDERLYAMQDANWNVTAIANASGTVQERYAYSAYGVPIFLDAAFASRGSSSYQWETLYAGYRWDVPIRHFHVRYRVFSPIVGTWLQRDAVGYTDGIDLYEFCRGNPLNRIDPSGTVSMPWCIFWATAFSGTGTACVLCLAGVAVLTFPTLGAALLALAACVGLCCAAAVAFQGVDSNCPGPGLCSKHPNFWNVLNALCLVDALATAAGWGIIKPLLTGGLVADESSTDKPCCKTT